MEACLNQLMRLKLLEQLNDQFSSDLAYFSATFVFLLAKD